MTAKARNTINTAERFEYELIGALLHNPVAAWPEIDLSPDCFVDRNCKLIWSAMDYLHGRKHEPPFSELITAALPQGIDAGWIAALGSPEFCSFRNTTMRAELVWRGWMDRECEKAAKNRNWARIAELQAELNRPRQADRNKHLNGLTITAAELDKLHFADMSWLIDGVLPEGTTILIGPPKVGKTRLAIQISLALASGGFALNRPETAVKKTGVLYLGFESGQRRMQKAIRELFGDGQKPANLHFMLNRWRRVDEGGLADLDDWLEIHSDVGFFVIDTLAAFRSRQHGNGKGLLYSQDYTVGDDLKQLADKRQISTMILHHPRKGESIDPVEIASGSNGVTGSMDHILIMKRERMEPDGKLTLISRDQEDSELALRFEHGLWTLLGTKAKAQADGWMAPAASPERREILDLLRGHGPMEPVEIARRLGKERIAIRRLLCKMHDAEEIGKNNGLYQIIENDGNRGNRGNSGNSGNRGNSEPVTPVTACENTGNRVLASQEADICPPVTPVTAVTGIRAKPAHPPGNGGDPEADDPIARRIAELIDDGWSPWNARAKAMTEAREGAQ